MTDLLDAAHAYRNRGWRVIQLHSVGPDGRTCTCARGANCPSAGKHPINTAWQDTEAYSAPDIQALWERRPKANVGIATGSASGVWVLDLDSKNGKDGVESLRALVAEHGALPLTYTAQTGSGGWHYYFLMPDDGDVANSQGRIAPGIDVRGTGGQVVAAPSTTDSGTYRVLRDVPVAEAPEWLLALTRRKESTAPVVTAEDLPKPEDLSQADWDRLNAYANRAIDAEVKRLARLQHTGWSGEPWNATTFEVACTLLEFENSPWCAYASAAADVIAYAPRDDAGFDDAQIETILDSARATIGDKARAMPPDRRSEPDDLFDNPDVRSVGPNPTDPAEGDGGPRRVLFSENTPLYSNMADAVLDQGPLAWGRDNSFWAYKPSGVWVPQSEAVETRLIDLLENKFLVKHVTNTTPIVRYRAARLTGEPLEPLMNFANGMLDWRTGEVSEHAPEYLSTIQFGYDWDPEAECPRFDAFLADVMHPDYVALTWEALGYLMLAGNPLQVAFLLYGSGGNGKGTLMRVIEDLLGGSANIANESLDDLNGNRFSAVNLFGKIANLAGDIDGTYQESTANFKKLTGEDSYPGERKYGDRFTFESWAVPVFSANKIPGSADVTEGYLRRWIVLHFHKRITEVIPGFSDILKREVPGIAAKAVPALRTLMERKEFAPQGEALKGKEEFALTIDQVRQWIASGDLILNDTALTPAPMLYGAYRAWADRAGQGRLRQQEWAHRLDSLGYKAETYAGIVHYRGLVPDPNLALPSPTTALASISDF